MLSTLEADRAHVAALTAQLLDLEKSESDNSVSISGLRLEQALVQSRLDAYKYPVLTLPAEIVAEIFLHIPPPYPVVPSPGEIRSLFSLACICRRWRKIAISITSLWRAIKFSNNGIPSKQRAHIFKQWISRSRSRSLSIEFDAGGDEFAAIAKVMRLITPHRSRWEHLKLVLLLIDVHAIEGGMPMLRHLDLEISAISGMKPISFGELPLLRSVVLNGTALKCAGLGLPWTQLTSVVLHGVKLGECTPILSQASSLVHCELHLVSAFGDVPSIVTVPWLESLVLKFSSYPHQHQYLKFFITPALRRLRIPELFLGKDPILSLLEFSKSADILQEVYITGKRAISRKSYRDALPSVSRFSFSPMEDGRHGGEHLVFDSDTDSSNTD